MRRALLHLLPALAGVVMWSCANGAGTPPVQDTDKAGSAERRVDLPPRQGRLSLDDRRRWQAVLGWPADCEDAFQASHAGDDGGLAFSELTPGLSIVQVTCAAGGYQPSQIFLRLDERGSSRVVTPLAFEVYTSPDGVALEKTTETEIVGEPHLAAERRELTVLSLARQLGDCGIWSRFGIGGERPRLLEAADLLPCPEKPGSPVVSEDGNAPRGWRPISSTR